MFSVVTGWPSHLVAVACSLMCAVVPACSLRLNVGPVGVEGQGRKRFVPRVLSGLWCLSIGVRKMVELVRRSIW